MKKNVVVLGSSGSIGKNTVKVLTQLSSRFQTVGLAVNSSVEVMAEQASLLNCRRCVVADKQALDKLQSLAPAGTECRSGMQAMIDMVTADDVDIVVCAIVGTGGLLPGLAALQANKRVALASKEVMVMAGDLVNAQLDAGCGHIVPVDSEHSALFQCLESRRDCDVKQLILTASGGAFRDWPPEKLASARLQDARKHPVWDMGSKVTRVRLWILSR